MHLITKTINGKKYLYLAWNEKIDGQWKKRSQYLAKAPKAAIKKLESLDIPLDEKTKLIESLDSDVWETEDMVLDLVRAVMGGIDLDPTTKPSNPTGAAKFYTKDDDALVQPWEGRVYMNPPYSNPAPFIEQLVKAYEAGTVTEAIALCKQGVVSNKSTQPFIKRSRAAQCMWLGRMPFKHSKAKDKGNSPNFDVVLIYWGSNAARFKEVFEPYGDIS